MSFLSELKRRRVVRVLVVYGVVALAVIQGADPLTEPLRNHAGFRRLVCAN